MRFTIELFWAHFLDLSKEDLQLLIFLGPWTLVYDVYYCALFGSFFGPKYFIFTIMPFLGHFWTLVYDV